MGKTHPAKLTQQPESSLALSVERPARSVDRERGGNEPLYPEVNSCGRVTIAEEVREIQFSANLGINDGPQIVATGLVPMNFRNYSIDPPTALLVII